MRTIFNLLASLPSFLRKPLARTLIDGMVRFYSNLQVFGQENRPTRSVLFICNHLSNVDAFILQRALAPSSPTFLAGVKLGGTAMTKVGMEVVDTIPIHPNSPDRTAIRLAVDRLQAGHSVLIFPEGGRSRTGSLRRGRAGAILIAKRAGVPLVPLALTGTDKLMPINDRDMGAERIHKADVSVTIGKPFLLEELEAISPDRQMQVDALMLRIAALLPPEYKGVYASPESLAQDTESEGAASTLPPESANA